MKWYKSFFNQVVKKKNNSSKAQLIKRGIIQGENNSQFLFSIFINNITRYIKSSKIIILQLYIGCHINKVAQGIEKLTEEMIWTLISIQLNQIH